MKERVLTFFKESGTKPLSVHEIEEALGMNNAVENL